MAIENRLIKTWRHKETGRYIATIHEEFIDTTKVLIEAYHWDVDIPGNTSNCARFTRTNKDLLEARGFELVTLVLQFDTEKQELIYDIFGKDDCYYDNKRATRANRSVNSHRRNKSR